MIQIEELYKYYGERKAIGPLSCAIEAGEIVGLLGLNGAGKTTTLRILSCDLLPSSGRVIVGGLNVVDHPHEVRKRIGYLPDTPPLYGEMTVQEYLTFAARLRGVGSRDLKARVDDAIEQTELGRVQSEVIASLSHGYKQRVGIGQAIVHKPELLVLDEPISGLDPAQIVEMRELLKGLRGEHTVILSSHILSEISETCDRILVIADGRIAAAETEAELQTRLSGAGKVAFTVRGGRDDVHAALGKIDGVVSVVDLDPTERGGGVVTVEVSASRDVREDACAALVGAKLGILEVKVERELEALFLRLATPAQDRQDKTDAKDETKKEVA